MFRKKLVQSMIKNNVIHKDDYEIYCFGLQILSETVISFLAFLIIAILFNKLIETIIFLVSFAFLRQFAGGYHAGKFIHCLMISCMIIIIFNFSLNLIGNDLNFSYICSLVTIPIIVSISPVDSIYKPLHMDEIKKYKRYLIYILYVEIMILVVFIFSLKICYAICITYSWVILSLLLMIGKVQNMRKN